MGTNLNPYLSFRDTAREAMEFYRSTFGGALTISTFGEMMPDSYPAERDKVMHAQLESPDGLVLMASDTPADLDLASGSSISIALSGDIDTDAELRGYWEKLTEDGTVVENLTTSPWGDAFGMCTDRFGTTWMVNISAAAA